MAYPSIRENRGEEKDIEGVGYLCGGSIRNELSGRQDSNGFSAIMRGLTTCGLKVVSKTRSILKNKLKSCLDLGIDATMQGKKIKFQSKCFTSELISRGHADLKLYA